LRGPSEHSTEGHAGVENSPRGDLRDEFLRPRKMSMYHLAKELHVPAPRVNYIVLQRRGITADAAVRLARFFGTSEQFWLGLQSAYEVSAIKAEAEMRLIGSCR
jgi:antitoxin HigA-1